MKQRSNRYRVGKTKRGLCSHLLRQDDTTRSLCGRKMAKFFSRDGEKDRWYRCMACLWIDKGYGSINK